jgi:hypothetical protein
MAGPPHANHADPRVIEVVITAVPERRAMVDRLLSQLDRPTRVFYDDEHQGHVFTWWRAVDAALERQPSHILVLQEDVAVCRDLVATCHRLVALVPDQPIHLFHRYGTRAALEAAGSAWMWRRSTSSAAEQAVIFPAADMPELRRRWDARRDEMLRLKPFRNDQPRSWAADSMRHFLMPRTLAYTVPSLVEHIGGRESSIVGHNVGERRGVWFIGEDVSGLSVDWTRGLSRRR